jgi:hypothetical protein
MRIVRNIEQARQKAQSMWGPRAAAWILAGTRYVSHDTWTVRPGWNHFDGQGKTWDEAFIDAAFRLKIAEMQNEEATA